jgi:hypothetical protein
MLSLLCQVKLKVSKLSWKLARQVKPLLSTGTYLLRATFNPYGTQLPTLSELPQSCTQTSILARCPSLSITAGTIRPGDGAFCLPMSSSELSSGGSKEKPTGAIASYIGTRTSVRNVVAAFSRYDASSRSGSKGRRIIKMKVKCLR